MDTNQGPTWQKFGVIAAILIVIVPWVAKEAYGVVFPPYYLIYQLQHPINGDGFAAFAAIITNVGSQAQDGITLTVPSDSYNPDKAYVDVGTPSKYSFIQSSNPKLGELVHANNTGFIIPVGRLMPGETVRVTLITEASGQHPIWLLSNAVRVESKQGLAKQTDDLTFSEADDSLHAVLWEASPYFVAFILSLLAVFASAGLIYSIAFDSKQKQMARLWKQMDTLQQKIDKERRYE